MIACLALLIPVFILTRTPQPPNPRLCYGVAHLAVANQAALFVMRGGQRCRVTRDEWVIATGLGLYSAADVIELPPDFVARIEEGPPYRAQTLRQVT